MALKLHSPVHITRPLDEVHTNCERDVGLICNEDNIHVEHNLISELMKDNSQTILDLEEKNDETLLPRRLTDTGSDAVPKSRSYSIKVGLRIAPRGSKDLDQRVKDNERFLNYGPNTDTCLWNAFDSKQVSSQCASALTRINEITDYPTMKYSNESEYIKRRSISISFPLVTVIFLILGCMLFRELCVDVDDDDDIARDDKNKRNTNDVVDLDQCDYHMLDESQSKLVAHVAVPLDVI